ncbi:type VII secretion system-associated protein [Streptomyces atroolivaceus]|uniref:Type VII secretion system-associated protein n=1 Tax=Streptomyces atroolivaceus TaxID=66869 RepID=A0ABV9VBK7_STRAZ|nr:type VII secretion system-associated protein [Streptomyces atroolivaceus]
MSELGTGTPAAPLDPAPPEEFLQAARLAPDHWLYLPDPAWQGEGPPPEWAVVGQWRSDSEGEIVEWEDNEDYRPSPEAMGWPEPADDVDRAVQLATTGYGPAEDVTAALARAEVAVLVTAGGEPVSASAPDGTAVVPVYTSPRYLQAAGRLGFERLPVADLIARIPPDHGLCINSSAQVSMVLGADGLAQVLREAAGEAGGEAGAHRGTPATEAPAPGADGPDQGEPAAPQASSTQTDSASGLTATSDGGVAKDAENR